MQLFRLKIVPTLTYGIEEIWESLTNRQMEELEKVKTRYLKRVLGVSKCTQSRLVYKLAREMFLIEDLRLTILLPSTIAYETVLRDLQNKRKDILETFYTADAMTNRVWTKTNYQPRHVMTRTAVHGFHFKLCRERKFHEPDDQGMCQLCSQQCERYHVMNCPAKSCSLTELAKE